MFQVVLVLAVHSCVFQRLLQHGQLDPAAYGQPVIAVEILKDDGLLICFLLALLPLFLARRYLRWQDIDRNRRTRWLIFIAAGLLVWGLTTTNVNLYFDQRYSIDRILLAGLWLALLVHPIALLPLLLLLVAFAGQVHYPLIEGLWAWPDKRLPLDVLALFLSYLFVAAALLDRVKPYLLPFMMLCLVGATYGQAAVNKALLGPHLTTWVLHDDLSNLFIGAHLNGGWMSSLGDDGAVQLAHVLHTVHVPIAIASFTIELSGLALLVRWRLTRFLLPAFVMLHLSILAASGIFFWKWIVIDVAMLAYLVALRRDAERDVAGARERVAFYRPRLCALGLAVMLFAAPRVFQQVPFAWFDSRLVNYFQIYGITERHTRYRLDSRFFEPYQTLLEQSRHYYLVPEPVVVGTYGTTPDWNIADALQHATPADLPAIYKRYGTRWLARPLADGFVEFVRRYVANAERRGGRYSALSWIAPPYHFQRAPPPDVFDFQEPLTDVEIHFVEYLYDGEHITQTRDLVVAQFPVHP